MYRYKYTIHFTELWVKITTQAYNKEQKSTTKWNAQYSNTPSFLGSCTNQYSFPVYIKTRLFVIVWKVVELFVLIKYNSRKKKFRKCCYSIKARRKNKTTNEDLKYSVHSVPSLHCLFGWFKASNQLKAKYCLV